MSPYVDTSVMILAGGRGHRLHGEDNDKVKALTPVGERTIIEHIVGCYARFGFEHFVIALGHNAEYAAEAMKVLAWPRPAQVECVDTGEGTGSGGRVQRAAKYLRGDRFMLTWCDGLSDVNFDRLYTFHEQHRRQATVTAVHPPPRFGRLEIEGERVVRFQEKPPSDEWINGAFFVLERSVTDLIQGPDNSWERDVLPRLAEQGELMAYRHRGFWQCMDLPTERAALEALWRSGQAPWADGEPGKE